VTTTVSLPLPMRLKARVRTWVDEWMPEDVRLRGPEARRRARLVVVISLLAAPAGGLLALVLLLLGANSLSLGFSAGTVLLLVAPLVLRNTGSVDAAGLWACLNLLWPLSLLAASGQGGAAAPGGFALVALLSALLVPRTLSFALGALTVVACVVTGVLAAPHDPLLSLVAVTTTLAVFAVAMVYRATADDALHRFHAAITQYRAEADKHRRTRATLEDVHRELLEQAAIAGRAEIANGILHNVGNTINWVGLAAAEIGDQLEESRAPKLRRAAALLASHRGRLGAWEAAEPEQARQLAEYLDGATLALAAEREEVLQEVRRLVEGLDHIKSTVRMQQAYARPTLLEEVVSVTRVIDEAIRYSDASVRVPNLRIEKQVDDLPLALLDKHRLMQVLVNLIGNAKHAVRDGATDGPLIVIRAEVSAAGRLRIRVTDNGVGIAGDDKARIFRHGFTTKRDGHGFGLHSCQVAVEQMGGALTCDSPGPEKGAEFVLDLPLQIVRRPTGEADQPTEVVPKPSWVEEDSDSEPILV
jgi:signal transduction histidine kinase